MTSRDDVLDALESVHLETGDPIATAPEIAERLDVDRRRTLGLLEVLKAAGDVESRHVGRGRAWWSTSAVSVLPLAEPPAEPLDPDVDPPSEPTPEPVDVDSGRGLDRALVEDLDLPGQGERLEQRRDVLLDVLEYLQDAGEARAGEIKTAMFSDRPAGYSGERSWWKNFVGPALGDLADQDVVTLVDSHDGVWRFA